MVLLCVTPSPSDKTHHHFHEDTLCVLTKQRALWQGSIMSQWLRPHGHFSNHTWEFSVSPVQKKRMFPTSHREHQRESQLKTCMERTNSDHNTIRYVAEGNIINSMGAPTVPVDLHGDSTVVPASCSEHLPSGVIHKKESGPSSNCAKGIEIGEQDPSKISPMNGDSN